MKHNFKFQLGQAVRVLDYDSPRTEHYAAVVRRWLEAYRGNEDPDELEEQYEVELTFNGNKQRHMFLVDDITEDVNGNYWRIKNMVIGHAKNHWLKKRKDKDLASLQWLANNDGFPQDDEFSLQQGCNGEGNLEIFYAHQYIQNETLEWEECERYDRTKLDKSHILPGSVVVEYNGELCNDDDHLFIRTKAGKAFAMVNHKSGIILCRKGDDKFGVVSYEYDHHKHQDEEG